MATVVNNPGTTGADSGFGFLAGVLLLIAAVFLFLYFGIPAVSGFGNNRSIEEGTSIDVPKEMSVM